ncbi:MAG TPA: SDR family oxidoreductase [Candidatus Omnitrophota bacterium]|nr:SDR family oxidoreductase [Candidatus Omnitrophota bacterium]
MPSKRSREKNVFVLGIGSDIGKALAERYCKQGYNVVGAYRNTASVRSLLDARGVHLLKCDVGNKADIRKCVNRYKELSQPWDIFISCVGSMEPIGRFFGCNFDQWERSVNVNSVAQLRFLHEIYPYRRQRKPCHVVFFAGGGTNNPFTNYSAYCASKIMLIKACELLDDENPDLNVFILGPGWVRTKIHDQTLEHRAASGRSYNKTIEFLRSKKSGTSYEDIYDCINWCMAQGRDVVGGRNFSVVHDPWREKGMKFKEQLYKDKNKFKLRRYKNI